MRFFLFLLFAAGSLTVFQQALPPVAGRAVVAGQVVDYDTGRPVADAVVTLDPTVYRSGPNEPRVARYLTTADGRFEFTNVIPATYQIRVSKSGRTGEYGKTKPGGSGVSVPVGAGQHLEGLTIPLFRPSTIRGTVLDERGRPMQGLTVSASRPPGPGSTGATSEFNRTAKTDDRGEYQLTVPPGSYVVFVEVVHAVRDPTAFQGNIKFEPETAMVPAAIRDRDGRFVDYMGPVPPAPSRDGKTYTYVTTFAPGVRNADSARVIRVSQGEDVAGVDFSLLAVRSFRVSGRIVGGDAPDVVVSITLTGPQPSLGIPVARMAATSDTLLLMNVPEGDYLLEASRSFGRSDQISKDREGLWARVPVSVHEGTTDDWTITMRPGLHVSGVVQFDPPPPPGPKVTIRLERQAVTFFDGFAGMAQTATADSTGAFDIAGVIPGRYVIRTDVSADRTWEMKSALRSGEDVGDRFFVLAGDSLSDVVVTLTKQAASLSGTAHDARGPASNATVVVFPADSVDWIDLGRSNRRLVKVRTTQDGTYSIRSLPPGDYCVAAVEEDRAADWPSVEYLQLIASFAQRVKLSSGDRPVLDLRVGGR